MGNGRSQPATNSISTGQSVFVNERGETVTDSFHHINDDFYRRTEKGKLPETGGYFTQSSLYTPWAVAIAATVLLVLSVALFTYSRRPTKQTKKDVPVNTEKVGPGPLYYSLTNGRSHHASHANWNSDLLEEVDLEA
ncbi:hypothetical protein Ocin01_07792 [Orchesella cincta]|uniref:Uncharacterized protein n=1 Tax=Orchesella cincta TaxID=48709 RepID=A0A1D2N1H8_ORCCI|nr:hypothetical protein Ocin01_07792 [Orchesella cincta]